MAARCPQPRNARLARASNAVTRHPVAAPRWACSLLAICVLVALWDWNWFKRPVERQVQARTGREFDIGGDLDVDPWAGSPRSARIGG